MQAYFRIPGGQGVHRSRLTIFAFWSCIQKPHTFEEESGLDLGDWAMQASSLCQARSCQTALTWVMFHVWTTALWHSSLFILTISHLKCISFPSRKVLDVNELWNSLFYLHGYGSHSCSLLTMYPFQSLNSLLAGYSWVEKKGAAVCSFAIPSKSLCPSWTANVASSVLDYVNDM